MTASPKHLLCFDFDGTLVDTEIHGPVPPDLLERIATLKKQRGATWTINTGRSLFQAIAGITDHVVHPYPDYVIAQERAISYQNQHNRWVDFGDWNKRCHKDHRKFFRSTARFFKRVRNFVETATGATYFPATDGPAGVLAQSDEEMEAICEYLEIERRKVPVLGYQRNGLHLRFSHAHYHKGSALGELGRLLDLEAQFVFAAGDNHNDLSMLSGEYAHAVACPANALPEVKEAVKAQGGYVAEAAFSAGVAEAVRYYYY